MPDSTPQAASYNQLRSALKQGWDVDFIRARFNLSSREVENAIRYAGNNREKLIEYFRKSFASK